ncbi:MAG: UMP kinase [Myxococcota bacterium]
MSAAKHRRVLLKLSGEALLGQRAECIDQSILASLASQIRQARARKIQLAVVIGGGNMCRGAAGANRREDRARADAMGMLATVINALALQGALQQINVPCRAMSAITMAPRLCEPYDRARALRALDANDVVICAGGTGNPYFTTDTAAALRALELNCQVLFKATKVNGIYDKDPAQSADARCYESLTHRDVVTRRLRVMDLAAVCLCEENHLPIHVFNCLQEENLLKALQGQLVGTRIHSAA